MANVRPLKIGSNSFAAQMADGDTIPANLIGITPVFEAPTGLVNGSNTSFSLSSTPVANASVIIVLDGLIQTNGTDYTVSGTTVTFTTAPASGSEIVAIYNSAAAVGGGDFSSNTSSSVDSEIVLFSGTGGKTGKRASGSGYPKLTSGVLSVLTAPQLRSETAANVITPSQITGDQDNYAPTGFADATVVRISGDSGFRAITGFTATGAYDGQVKQIANVGSYPIYIPGEHPDSSASNRVSLPYDYIIFPNQCAFLCYDSTSSRWRIMSPRLETLHGIFYKTSFGSTTAGDWGTITFTQNGTGAGASTANATVSLPGALTLNTGTTTSGISIVSFSKTITSPVYNGGTLHILASATISLPFLSTGTETFTAALMITASPTSTTFLPNNTFGIRYTNGVNSGKLQGFTKDNTGTESTVDLGVTVSGNVAYLVRIEVDKSNSEVRFYVNNSFAGRITSNMPTAGLCAPRCAISKSAGSTSRILNVHNMIMEGISI